MAFFSRSAQQEFGSGGKILRGRQYMPQFSPYSRPSSSVSSLALLAAEPDAGGSPSWFRGLISGAGKLISSVIGSEGSYDPSECSSDYSSEEEYDPPLNEHGDNLLSDDVYGFNKREHVEGNVESLVVVSKSKTKRVIEQLLLQETFTRDEYNRLMEILRSRVLDIPSAKVGEVFEEELPAQVSERSTWQSFNQKWNMSVPSSISPSNQSSFSRTYYISEAVTPDLRNRAVMEAKKWFEEKKPSPRSVCDQECGPCVLNTDMNRYLLDCDSGSPIEMAKSYMQSLPPWRSPSFSTSSFKKPPSIEKHTSSSTGTHLLQSSKVRKRDYSAIGSLQSSDISLKLISDGIESSKLKQRGSAPGPSLFEVSRVSPAIANFSNKVQDSYGGGILSDEPLTLHDRVAAEVGVLLDMRKEISEGSIVKLQDAFKEAQEIPKITAEDFIKQPYSDINSILPCDSDLSMSGKNQVIEARIDNISAPHSSLLMSMADGDDGGTFPETETFQHEIVIPREPRTWRSKEDAIIVNVGTDFKHGSRPPDGSSSHTRKETAEAADITDGHSEEVNNNVDSGLGSLTSRGGPTATNSGNSSDAVAASFSKGTHQRPGGISKEVPCSAEDINSGACKRLNPPSTEGITPEPSPAGRGRRRGKKVVRQKGCRG